MGEYVREARLNDIKGHCVTIDYSTWSRSSSAQCLLFSKRVCLVPCEVLESRCCTVINMRKVATRADEKYQRYCKSYYPWNRIFAVHYYMQFPKRISKTKWSLSGNLNPWMKEHYQRMHFVLLMENMTPTKNLKAECCNQPLVLLHASNISLWYNTLSLSLSRSGVPVYHVLDGNGWSMPS